MAVLLWILALVGIPIALIVGYVVFSRKKRNNHPLIRYPRGYPIVGNFFNFGDEVQLRTCIEFPQKYGPFLEFYVVSLKLFMVCDSTICKEILTKRPKKFRRTSLLEYPNKVLQLSSGLFGAEGAVWSHIRKSTAPSFSNLNISLKFPSIVQEIALWVKHLQTLSSSNEKKEIDMKKEASLLTVRIITIVAFGLDPDDPMVSYFFTQFVSDVNLLFMFIEKFTTFPVPEWLWKYSPGYSSEVAAREADARFSRVCQKIIDYKRQLLKEGRLPMNCMMDSMMAHAATNEGGKASSGLTDEEIIANVKVFYIAGSDTTSVTITWLMYHFSQNPAILPQLRQEAIDKLFASSIPPSCDELLSQLKDGNLSWKIDQFKDLPFTHCAIKEALRMGSPANFIFLETTDESVTLSNGIELEPHQIVLINTDGLHFDQKVFPEPLVFSPKRWLISDEKQLQEMEGHYFPFGYGPRVCPGMNLALVEVAVVLSLVSLTLEKVDLLCPKEEIKRIPNFIVAMNKMPLQLHFSTAVNR